MHEVESLMVGLAEGPPWHRIGTTVEGAVGSEQALRLAGLDWEVEQRPVYAEGPFGVLVPIHGMVANVRTDDDRVLGVVGDRYRVVQNRDAFGFVDLLLEGALGTKPRYTSAGSLRGGQRVFLCALLPGGASVLGDDLRLYLVFSNSHDGHTGVQVAVAPVRVACMNTLNLALRRARRSWATTHVGHVEARMWEAQRSLDLARDYARALEREARRLARVRLDLAEWIERLMPISKSAPRHIRSRIERRRQALWERAQQDNLASFGGTAWAFINAVADFTAHVRPVKAPRAYDERLAERIIDGHPFLDRAYDLLRRRLDARVA